MSNLFHLHAEARTDVGKGASRRLRREGKVPAVVYGTNKVAESLSLEHSKVIHSLEQESFYSRVLDLSIDGTTHKVVLKDVQRHPCKPTIHHLDFFRIDATEKLRMQIPLHFVGDDVAPGVKVGGGVVSHQTSQVEISCLPQDLPRFIEVDLSLVELDQTVHLSDLKLPSGTELVDLMGETPNDLPVASIHIPKVVEEPEPTEAAAEGEGESAAEAGEAGADESDK